MKLPQPTISSIAKFTSFKHKQQEMISVKSHTRSGYYNFFKRQKGRIKSFQRNIITKGVNTVSDKNISKQDKENSNYDRAVKKNRK